MLNKLKRFKADSSGQAAVIVAIALVVLLGFAAFAVDIGYAAHQKSVLQNTADSAALAGAMSIRSSGDDVVKAKVAQYVNANMEDPATIDGIIINRLNNSVKVSLSQETPKFFAGVISSETKIMEAAATAKTWSGEALPFINLDQDYEIGSNLDIWMKVDEGRGNFELLDDYAISPDHTTATIAYDGGVVAKKGQTVSDELKDLVEHLYAKGEPVYLFSLIQTAIDGADADKAAGVFNPYNPGPGVPHIEIPEYDLVLLEVQINDIYLTGNPKFLDIEVLDIIYDFDTVLPNANAGGASKAILVE